MMFNELNFFRNKTYTVSGYSLSFSELFLFFIRNPKWVLFLPHWIYTLLLIKSSPKSSPLTISIPWLNYGAINHISSFLKNEHLIYEYGSGGSTLFFSKRVKKVYSVEHDIDWYKKLKKFLYINNIKNVNFDLVIPENISQNKVYSHLSNTSTTFEKYRGMSFKKYVISIKEKDEKKFDLILIDGRARASCLYQSINSVKKGGMIVLDNSEREDYFPVMKLIDDKFKRTDYFGFGPFLKTFWRTTIWET